MAVDRRQGLNCTLTYSRGRTTYGFRVRCNSVTHGFKVTADESHARVRRAYYPHRLTPTQFAITAQLMGYPERNALTQWLMGYAAYLLNPDTATVPVMEVSVPSRNFLRRGIPLTGYEFGDHVGSMVFNPLLVFETSYDPLDAGAFKASSFNGSFSMQDPAAQNFYPSSVQLGGENAPSVYTQFIDPTPIEAVQQAVNGSPFVGSTEQRHAGGL